MSFRKRLLLFVLGLVVLAALDVLLAPFVVAHGVRWALEWVAQREGIMATMDNVEAPFLQPVRIRNLRLTSNPGATREVSLQAGNVELGLNLRGRIFSSQATLLREIQIDRLVGNVRLLPGKGRGGKLDWRQLARLIPSDFRVERADLDIATATTMLSFGELQLSASAVESGKFFARRLSISSPILRQTFSDLRGATSWEGDRLTIAGIALIPGLDLEALTLDLSRLKKRRLGIDLHLDAYGGTLRASFQGRAGEKFSLDVAGSAADVSLAQLSPAIGFLEPISGSVRASKFTFRGNPGEFLDATASIWMELTGFAWRARRADSVMLGATYYDRRLEVDQLYVRQRENELTINGELRWPDRRGSWMQLPFRGQLNATIPDLNGFAQLFGATTGDFTGALIAEGDLDSLAPEAHGRLKLRGNGVTFRRVTMDSLGASFQLSGREVTLENLEARHAQDFLRASGSFELAAGHRFAGRLTGAINDLGAYAPLLPAAWQTAKIGGGATFDWRGDGTVAANSGTMQFFAHGLQLPVAPLRMPLDLTLEGSYSPRDVFFRTFQIANDRASLGGFLMLGSNFIEGQALQLVLDGVPHVTGTLFLPLSLNRWRTTGSWLAAFDEEQKFDVDLTIDHLDLAALTAALGETSSVSGILNGRLAAFGPLRSLQLTTSCQLQNFGTGAPPNTLDLEAHYFEGHAEGELTAAFGVSTPVYARVSLPLRLEKDRFAAGTVLEQTAPFSFSLDCPALFLETLPNEWRFGFRAGILSGGIAFSNTLAAPQITGEAQLMKADLQPPAPWPVVNNLGTQVAFLKGEAILDPLHGEIDGTPVALRGRLTTNGNDFRLELDPQNSGLDVLGLPASGTDLSTVRLLGRGRNEQQPLLKEAIVRGEIGSAAGSLTLETESANSDDGFSNQTTLFLRPKAGAAQPLLLRALPSPAPAALRLSNRDR